MDVRTGAYVQNHTFYPPTQSPYTRPSPRPPSLPKPGPTAPPRSAGSPQGPPNRELLPVSCAMAVGKWKAGWCRTQWVSGLGRRRWPPALRQSLRPAAQTAEELGGGGGRETAVEGEGSAKARRRGGAGARKLVEGRWGRRVCGKKLPGRETKLEEAREESACRGQV